MTEQEFTRELVWNTNPEMIRKRPRPVNSYFQKAYDFMHLWMSGQEQFNLQTSGSTGVPKTITVTRKQLSSSAAMTGKALDLGEGTRALVCLNVAYVAGIMMLVRGMELNWELTIVEPSSNPLFNLEDEPHFNFVAMVPLQLSSCLENEETKNRVNYLGKILLGGAPVSISLIKEVANLPVPVYQSYGMTETVSHVALRKLNFPFGEGNYTILPGVILGQDERGCLNVSGPMSNEEKIQTNDLINIVSGNTFTWLGRIDNVINSGGVKIILDQVDELIANVFYDQKYTSSFFTWYEKDEKLGQKLILIMEKSDQYLQEEIILKEIRKKVSAYETPKHVYFADQFIKTETEKIDKRRTAEMLFKIING